MASELGACDKPRVNATPEAKDSDDGIVSFLLQRAENRMRNAIASEDAGTSGLVIEARRDAEPRRTAQSDLPNTLPKLQYKGLSAPYIVTTNGVARADQHRLLEARMRQSAGVSKEIVDYPNQPKGKRQVIGAGPNWFGLPETRVTQELRRDFQLLKMRGILDPKRHYKKEHTRFEVPEFSRVGTMIEGPADFYSSRLLRRDRKRSLFDEILNNEKSSPKFKATYHSIQASKTSGKKRFYKDLKKQRSPAIKRL